MVFKRFSDILLSLIGLFILLPFLLIIGIIILLDSKGGIFYVQPRVGKANKDFMMVKFRTMHAGSDKKGLLTVGGRDGRITGMGFLLRKYKLDELPQLWNVLKGDMSIVGPRPEVRKYVDLYNEEQRKVLSIKPGLTDYASLSYINENEILGRAEYPEKVYIHEILPAKLKLNLKYIERMSFLTDVGIIIRTVFRIFK